MDDDIMHDGLSEKPAYLSCFAESQITPEELRVQDYLTNRGVPYNFLSAASSANAPFGASMTSQRVSSAQQSYFPHASITHAQSFLPQNQCGSLNGNGFVSSASNAFDFGYTAYNYQQPSNTFGKPGFANNMMPAPFAQHQGAASWMNQQHSSGAVFVSPPAQPSCIECLRLRADLIELFGTISRHVDEKFAAQRVEIGDIMQAILELKERGIGRSTSVAVTTNTDATGVATTATFTDADVSVLRTVQADALVAAPMQTAASTSVQKAKSTSITQNSGLLPRKNPARNKRLPGAYADGFFLRSKGSAPSSQARAIKSSKQNTSCACVICGFVSKNVVGLLSHARRKHPAHATYSKVYTALRRRWLDRVNAPPAQKLQCTECSFIAGHQGALAQHMKLHANAEPLKSPQSSHKVDKNEQNASRIAKHSLTDQLSSDDEDLTDAADLAFRLQRNKKWRKQRAVSSLHDDTRLAKTPDNKRRGTPLRRCLCPLCNAEFGRRSDYFAHHMALAHPDRKEGELTLDDCPLVTTKDEKNTDYSFATAAGGPSASEKKPTSYSRAAACTRCEQCGLWLYNEKSLAAHMRRTHGPLADALCASSKPAVCVLCNLELASRFQLAHHMQRVHGHTPVANALSRLSSQGSPSPTKHLKSTLSNSTQAIGTNISSTVVSQGPRRMSAPTSCRHCSRLVRPCHLSRHMTKFHGFVDAHNDTTKSNAPYDAGPVLDVNAAAIAAADQCATDFTITFDPCSFCRQYVATNEMARHIDSQHPNAGNGEVAKRSRFTRALSTDTVMSHASRVVKSMYTRCRVCRLQFRRCHLRRHMRAKHPLPGRSDEEDEADDDDVEYVPRPTKCRQSAAEQQATDKSYCTAAVNGHGGRQKRRTFVYKKCPLCDQMICSKFMNRHIRYKHPGHENSVIASVNGTEAEQDEVFLSVHADNGKQVVTSSTDASSMEEFCEQWHLEGLKSY